MIINCFLFIPSTWHYLYVILIYKALKGSLTMSSPTPPNVYFVSLSW